MMLTDLADACRKSGLTVVEVKDWKTRGTGQMKGVKTVACHHTAGPKTGNMPSLNVLINGHASLAGPLSQLGLARDGTVFVVAAGRCNHAGVVRNPATQSNDWAIGIEAEATGVDPWPAAQYSAYVRLCRALIDHYELPISAVLGHKEICSPPGRKSDPNFDMTRFRQDIFTNQGDDMFEQKDRDLLAQLATKQDVGWFRDQLMALLRADGSLPPEELNADEISGPASRADVGWMRDQIAARLGFDPSAPPNAIVGPQDALPILEAILGKLTVIDEKLNGTAE